MATEIILPKFDDITVDATIAEWLVDVGDEVTQGDPVCDVTVDKVTLQVEALVNGTVGELLADVGEIIPVGEVIAVIRGVGEELVENSHRPKTKQAEETPAVLYSLPEGLPTEELPPMRRVVGQRMIDSKEYAPHFYLTTAVDMTAALDYRKEMKREKIRFSVNDMIIKASALALRKFPRVASIYHDGKYVLRDNMDVGFACAVGDEGLVVPVIRNADRKSLADIAEETKDFIRKARDKKLTPVDYAGCVFSVSNLSQFEVDQFTAIINPGDSCILAIGKTYDTPVVVSGEVAVRPIMKITLSSDHRTVDGLLAARFNSHVKSLLESPSELL